MKILLAICLICVLLVNCGENHGITTEPTLDKTNVAAVSRTVITNKADLQRVLVSGLATNMIVAYLGFPAWDSTWNDGPLTRLRWGYDLTAFPAGDTMPGYNIIGIAVDITNGFLEKWDFNYSGVVGKPIPVGENSRGNAFRAENPPVLKMFVVSSNATTNSTYVNSKEFPKLGYIPSIPTIQIGKWKDLRLEEAVIADSGNRSHKDWIFYIELTSTDAPHFQAVTTDNCGKLMLVTIDDNPLFPVFISDPIANGNLRIEMTNEATMEIAKEVFGKMVMKGMGSVLEK